MIAIRYPLVPPRAPPYLAGIPDSEAAAARVGLHPVLAERRISTASP